MSAVSQITFPIEIKPTYTLKDNISLILAYFEKIGGLYNAISHSDFKDVGLTQRHIEALCNPTGSHEHKGVEVQNS